MDQELLDQDIRKLLKKVGVTSHQNIVDAIRAAIAEGRIHGNEHLEVSISLKIPSLELSETIAGVIRLE